MTSHPQDKDAFVQPPKQQSQTGQTQQTQVVEAEIIDEQGNNYSYHSYDNTQNSFGGVSFGVHGRGWRQSTQFVQNPSLTSCLPAIITLTLALSLVIQHGFLAMLGFFFFYVLANVLSFAITLRRTLQGQSVFIWLNRILVWVGAYMLTLAVI